MLTRRGFTVVELVVVMVIMAILITLAGISISSSRANAKDAERKADIEILARGLEARYVQGPLNKSVTSPAYVKPGTYPSLDEMDHIRGYTIGTYDPTQVPGGYGPVALPGTTIEAFEPPGATGYGMLKTPRCTSSPEDLSAGSCLQTETTTGTYVYEPIDFNGSLCIASVAGCARFNLYYRLESTSTIQVYRSKHQ